jgi:hypothetical protein
MRKRRSAVAGILRVVKVLLELDVRVVGGVSRRGLLANIW